MSTGTSRPFISICIPAYKHEEYVGRLLKSVSDQTFTDFEVIITDDSPDDTVRHLVSAYNSSFSLRYIKNSPALGTPENWNEGIRLAKGQWIKLIHDDDWFACPDSLQVYVDAIKLNPGKDFFFSAYFNVKGQESAIVKPGSFRIKQLQKNPVTLLSKNIIGPPSVVIHRNDQQYFYDKNLKWLVDMDFYMRYLNNRTAVYIDKPIINIGLNEQQVTRSSSLVREVEIPEHFSVVRKTGVRQFENLLVYDAWWRLMRNLNIQSVDEIKAAGYNGDIPIQVRNLVNFQQKFPRSLLRFGPASKLLMTASYFYNRLGNSFTK
ncbi:glycosyltransferase family 2 protein [Flavitalea antarctica]